MPEVKKLRNIGDTQTQRVRLRNGEVKEITTKVAGTLGTPAEVKKPTAPAEK